MTTLKIVRDGAALNALVAKTVKAGATYRDMLHTAMVSALFHAAEHGQCAPLQRLFESLTTNDKTAVRGSYIRRIHAACGGLDWSEYYADGEALPVPEEILKAATEKGAWLTYSEKNGFGVKQDVKEAREAFKKLAEEKLINPDGEVWRRFYDRNNLAEVGMFGNKQVVAGINALLKNAKGESERKESTVDKKIIAMLAKVSDDLEAYMAANGDKETVDDTKKRSAARRQSAQMGQADAVH